MSLPRNNRFEAVPIRNRSEAALVFAMEAGISADSQGALLVTDLSEVDLRPLQNDGKFKEAVDKIEALIAQAEAHIRARPDSVRYLAFDLAHAYMVAYLAYVKLFLDYVTAGIPDTELTWMLDMAIEKSRTGLALQPHLSFENEFLATRSRELLSSLQNNIQSAQDDLKKIASKRLGPGSPRSNSSSDKRCFIATAAYASGECAEVDALRHYRDTVLLPHRAGQALVRAYYAVSPGIARRIDRSPALRKLTRRILDPLVKVVGKKG